jgi:hypothetical protein
MDEHEAAGIIFYGLDANRAGKYRAWPLFVVGIVVFLQLRGLQISLAFAVAVLSLYPFILPPQCTHQSIAYSITLHLSPPHSIMPSQIRYRG